MAFRQIQEERESALLESVLSGAYSLLLGAGASHDSSNSFGSVPLAGALLDELVLHTGAPANASLQRVFGLLNEAEIEQHITERLSGCIPGETVKGIFGYNWKRIFSFNIDDSLEAAYLQATRQTLHPIHFSDPFVDFQTVADLPLIYLHGTVRSPAKGYIFSRDQYIRMIRGDNPWMVVLSDALRSDPFIIMGSSLDEVDLEYYLSFRTSVTSRSDVAPSVYVSSEVNRVTEALCDQHNLIQFVGHSVDFIRYLKRMLPNPPQLEDRIAAGVRDILPGVVDSSAAMQFDADFELVPRLSNTEVGSNRFYHGNPPSWADLAAQLDVSRVEASALTGRVRASGSGGRQIVVLFGSTGAGKTTLLKRAAYNLAARGQSHVLWTSELGRMSRSTASTIDAIDGKIVMFVDNFADHAQSIADVLSRSEREDLVIVGGERAYRRSYLNRMLGSQGYEAVEVGRLSRRDVERLLEKMTGRMLVGSHLALARDHTFLGSLASDPIAVATCRIMNDFRPLRRIIDGLLLSADVEELRAFAAVGVAAHCFKGGLRRSIAARLVDAQALQRMLDRATGLSLRYVDRGNAFIATENSTIGDELLFSLRNTASSVLLDAFVDLAISLASYVNRRAIRDRSPEAKLAGRLFDFDDVVEKFLGDSSEEFYERTKEAWRWNSRYWEQTALLRLSQAERAHDQADAKDYLEEALQCARYSVAIEEHSFGLTTLGKVLMVLTEKIYLGERRYFEEATRTLKRAIFVENQRSRVSQHPFQTLILGSTSFLSAGGAVTSLEKYELKKIIAEARKRWPNERDLADSASRLDTLLDSR